MIFTITTRVREIVRVLRGLPIDDGVRQRTLAINAQLAKLRESRLAQEKYREKAALQEVQFVVEQMSELKESLTAAEQAAVAFVDQISDQAKAQLEDEWNKKAETLMTSVARAQENIGVDLPEDSKLNTK